MKIIRLFVTFSLMFAGCNRSGEDTSGSSLSTITVGKFKPADGAKDWKSLTLTVSDSSTGMTSLVKSLLATEFDAGSSNVDVRVKYGSYRFAMEYLDADGKTILYSTCPATDGKLPEVKVDKPKMALKVNLCATEAAGIPPGNAGSIGEESESEISIDPVLQEPVAKDPVAKDPVAKDPVVGGKSQLFVDSVASLNCTTLEGMKFGDAAASKSYICVVRIDQKALPGEGLYLKGSIKVKADGKSTRFRMSGFGLAGEVGETNAKSWSARDGLPLNIDETVPVGLGREACLAGNATDNQVGNITVFTDATYGLTLTAFEVVSLVPTKCK